jgi:DNA-directed RNA polymerase specialized sigma24 family protein
MKHEPSRDLLSQAIVESLKSWPEFQRRIFIETHYCGRSVEEIARALELGTGEVVQILQRCERRLYRALSALRNGTPGAMSEDSSQQRDYAAKSCCH